MSEQIKTVKRWLLLPVALLALTLQSGCLSADMLSENSLDAVQSFKVDDEYAYYDGEDLSGGESPGEDDFSDYYNGSVKDGNERDWNIADAAKPDIDGTYTNADDVSRYLVAYGELPKNFITKNEARSLGWSGGSLESYAPGMCIGGDRFGNYEGLLPKDDTYHECDIDTLGAPSRGAKRLVYSDDGDIYYTEDHYESFTLLYGNDVIED